MLTQRSEVSNRQPTSKDFQESLCPHCLRRVPASKTEEGNNIYIHRTCPEHGDIERVLIWKNDLIPFEIWTKPRGEVHGLPSCSCCGRPPASDRDTVLGSNCPYDCGICPQHQQRTCSVIIEVTSRCNLRCPVCFIDVPDNCPTDPDVDQIERILKNVQQSAGDAPIQLSGGEPTLRDDLPEIIHRAHTLGFGHIQVNTNGIRIAEDFAYAEAMREAGVTDYFLQFDGVNDVVYRKMRGRDLFSLKEAAIQAAAKLHTAVILVPTLVKGVNDEQIGAILKFAKLWMPTVKGVHFQPMAYLGRYPKPPRNEDRILIPDVLAAIEAQTDGELVVENFIPSACEDPRCSFSALAVLSEDGNLVPVTRIDRASVRGANAAEKSIAYVRRHWKYPATGGTELYPDMERIRNYSLCVSGMAFQDAWNIEINRLQRCCVHVAASDSRLVPFCAYYLTNAHGQRL